MTSCVGNTCGVGGWGGPLPGDPSNNSVLTATPAFGGIDVNWTFPTTNPFAVAYTKLYRGITSSFGSAILLKEVAGTFYYDRLEDVTRYYYWIRLVSVNGTEGDLIGPASAVAKPTIAGMIELLTGQIDSGLLANALKNRIDYIGILDSALTAEVRDRENGQTTLSEAIADVQAGVAQAHTFILNETNTRTSENSALVEQITGVAATAGDALVAATTLLQGEIDTKHGISMDRIDFVYGQLGNEVAGVSTTMGINIGRLDGRVDDANNSIAATNNRINALYTVRLTVNDLVGGFGLANDGHVVEAGFDVDTFWVGRTQANKRKPFIISDGVVYIDDAAINKLTFSKLRDESGSFIVENGKVKADYLSVIKMMGGAMTGYASPATTLRGFYLGPEGFLVGNETDNRFFKVDASTGNVSAPGLKIINGQAEFSGSLAAARIAVGLGGTRTTFFDPTAPNVALRSQAAGQFSYNGNIYGPVNVSTGQCIVTGDTVKFKCLDGTWPEGLRVREGVLTFQILATAGVEHRLSLWIKRNSANWEFWGLVNEANTGIGNATFIDAIELALGAGESIQFGLSNADSAGNQPGDRDYSGLYNAKLVVTAVNF